MAMNKWVKRKWVRALRSGEYKKGQGRLIKEDRYCCLGVLAAEMVPEFTQTLSPWKEVVMNDGYCWLPDDLAILWGLDENTQGRLGTLNDSKDSFEPVIAYIEENL